MASYQFRNGTYRVRAYAGRDENGKDKYASATYKPDPGMTEKQIKKALDKFMADFEARVKSGSLIEGDKTTFREFSEIWIRDHASKTLEESTLAGYKTQLNLYILPEIGSMILTKIKPYALQQFINRMADSGKKDGSGMSRASLKQITAVISSVMETARKWQLIQDNPCRDVEIPKKKEDSKPYEPKHFTVEQAQAFLDFLDEPIIVNHETTSRKGKDGKPVKINAYTEIRHVPLDIKLFLTMAMLTGARREELLALTWEDVDLDKHTLNIWKATVLSADSRVLQKDTKNLDSYRKITLQDTLCELLSQWKAEQKRGRISVGLAWEGFSGKQYDKNYIFTQWNGKQTYPSTPYRAFKRIIARYNANLPEGAEPLPDIPLHGLRHTAATITLATNVHPKVVSKRLGHKNVSTTLNIYAHVLKSQDEAAADALEDAVLPKKRPAAGSSPA